MLCLLMRIDFADKKHHDGKFVSRWKGAAFVSAVSNFNLNAGSKQSCSEPEAFAASCEEYYAKLKQAEAWTDTQYKNSSDALSAMLELVRQHKVCLACK